MRNKPTVRATAFRKTMLAVLLAAAFTPAFAGEPIALDIPAQSLAAALKALSSQANVQILIPSEQVQDKSSQPLKGSYTTGQALEKLLQGSGLTWSEKEGVIAVKVVSPEQVTEMAPIEVRGATDKTSYAIPNATTGTKTDTPLIVTPVAVTVIPQQVLKDQQITKLEEAVTNSSGVWMYSSGQGCNGTCEAVALRGFTSFSNNVLKDGLMVPTAGGLTNMSNVESVEVVKGPASILYGRMEPGGVVSVITKKPKSKAGYSLEQTVGTHSTYLTNLDATGPANNDKSLLYRINMSWDSHDGYWTQQNNDRKFIAPSLQWNISPQTQALLETTYTKDKYASLNEINPVDPVTNQTVQLSPSGKRSPSLQYTDTTYAKLGLTHNFSDEWSVKAQVLQSKSNQSSDSNSFQVAGFTQVGATWTVDRALSLTHGYTNVQSTQLDMTGHFDTGSLKHTLLLGADSSKTNSYTTTGNNLDALAFNYVMDTTNAFNPSAPAGGQTANTWWGTLNVDKRQGVYLQDQIKMSHDVHLLVGLRYSKVTFDSQDDVSGVFVTAFGVPASTIRATRSDSAVTPRLGLLWEARPGTSLYASYSENFGNYQPNFDWQNKALDPQLAKQKEIGVKQQSIDGKLSASLAIFDIRKTNEAIVDPAHTGCRSGTTGIIGAGNPCYMAAGLTRSQGIELDLIGEVSQGWNLIANYSYNDTRILNNGGGTGEGQRVGYYPAHMARLATTYAIHEGWKIGVGVTSMGSTDLGNTSPTQTISPGYTLYDAMASYDFRLASYKAAFQLNIKNLFDKSYLVTASKNGAFSITPHGDPRSVLAKLKLDF